jgi:Hemerythrin HHE cation binding domain
MLHLSIDPRERPEWRAALRALLERHPRKTWSAQRSGEAAFWLEIHARFRHDCIVIEGLAADARAGRLGPRELVAIAGARLTTLVADLEGHHRIEDHHYFPVFRRVDARLASGFDALEADHRQLSHRLRHAYRALDRLRTAIWTEAAADEIALAVERFSAAAIDLGRTVCRHLDDEEDLVVPLLIEQQPHY